MFSKDPSELTRKEKLNNEEISRSIRLALAAELDAINFYLQQSSVIPEGSFRKVHEDIAREEVTHFGEFLRLLYEYEPDEFEKIKEGWKEASDLLSSEKPLKEVVKADGSESDMEEREEDGVEKGFLKHFESFRKVDWHGGGIQIPEDEGKILPFPRIVYEFSVKKGINGLYRDEEMKKNLRSYEKLVADELLIRHELSLDRRSTSMKSGDWTKSGEVLRDVISAMEKLTDEEYFGEYTVLASTTLIPLLLRQSGDSGQTELDLIREAVGNVQISSFVRKNRLYVVNNDSFWVLVRDMPELKEIAETVDHRNYIIEGRIAPLLFDRKGSICLEFKK